MQTCSIVHSVRSQIIPLLLMASIFVGPSGFLLPSLVPLTVDLAKLVGLDKLSSRFSPSRFLRPAFTEALTRATLSTIDLSYRSVSDSLLYPGFPQSQLLTQSGRDKRCLILRKTAKTKFLYESANFSEEGMGAQACPYSSTSNRPYSLSLLEENSESWSDSDCMNSVVSLFCNFLAFDKISESL